MEFKDNAWPCMALTHVDQQAARIKELDDAVSGPLENITKMLETVNADTIFAGVIQTWKTENQTLKSRISDLEKRNADLEARLGHEQVVPMQYREAQLQGYIQELRSQVAALKEITIDLMAQQMYPHTMPAWEHTPEEDFQAKILGSNQMTTRNGKLAWRLAAGRLLAEEHPEAFR
jgi:DNA repair exonuclease SbcCD ATPase subunit